MLSKHSYCYTLDVSIKSLSIVYIIPCNLIKYYNPKLSLSTLSDIDILEVEPYENSEK